MYDILEDHIKAPQQVYFDIHGVTHLLGTCMGMGKSNRGFEGPTPDNVHQADVISCNLNPFNRWFDTVKKLQIHFVMPSWHMLFFCLKINIC